VTAHAHRPLVSPARLRGAGLVRRGPCGVIPAWRLQRLFAYRNETDPVTRDRLSRQFTLPELEQIPVPGDLPFVLWVGQVEASGWVINWDALDGERMGL
jgi:hypothetical protein